jgi:uncharacterized protein
MLFALLQLAAATAPSFDCARARNDIEHAICASDELAALDREEGRLYRIALRVPEAQRPALVARQRAFLRDRDSCPESAAPLAECIRDAYLWDIGDLRRMAALQDDNEGLSSGPVRYACDGGFPDAYVTRFATSPAQAHVTVVALNEGQPLVADPAEPGRLAGRYATDYVLEAGGARLRIGARICAPAR